MIARPGTGWIGLVLASSLGAGGAFAQTWPTKPIRIVSGFAPGGGVDIMARVLSPKLPEDASKFLREEIALWAAVVKASGAQAD